VKYFLPLLQRQPDAHIVNISSVFGMIAPPGQGAYAASKFAVRGFSEALGHELSGTGVKVSVVHPGGIRTNIARRARTGANTPEAHAERAQQLFDKAARTSPEKAAATIIAGVERDRRRILIGPDAWLIDRVQRLLPVKHGKLLEIFFKG
jgi:short-subunit dehydrogenase